MSHQRTSSSEAGFSLIELIVAVTVLVIGVLGVVQLVDAANRTTSNNRAREGATNLTRELIEDARSVSYGSLDSASLAATLASMSGGTVVGGAVRYTRRGVTFTSTPSVCYVDDPKDGYGSHAGATFCNTTTGADDTFASDYKRFTVVTTWTATKGRGTARQSAVINDPGSSFAPQITAFSMTAPTSCTGSPACAQIDVALSSQATFSVTTSRPAASVTWYVNDTKMGLASGSGTGPWTFAWQLGNVSTGTYTISARANAGKDGPVRNLVVQVKDTTLGPPTNPYGGINQLWSNVVELNWTPVPASVLGYDVERRIGTVWSPVTCYDVKGTTAASPRPTGSYCLDKAAAGATEYRIFTTYLKAAVVTKSTAAAFVVISTTNIRPCPPVNLLVTTTGKVDWDAPSGGAGCDASRVRFYRVYRNVNSGQPPASPPLGYGDRIFQTSGATVTEWQDPNRPNPTNKIHYWVTAVDNFNAESLVAGPVRN